MSDRRVSKLVLGRETMEPVLLRQLDLLPLDRAGDAAPTPRAQDAGQTVRDELVVFDTKNAVSDDLVTGECNDAQVSRTIWSVEVHRPPFLERRFYSGVLARDVGHSLAGDQIHAFNDVRALGANDELDTRRRSDGRSIDRVEVDLHLGLLPCLDEAAVRQERIGVLVAEPALATELVLAERPGVRRDRPPEGIADSATALAGQHVSRPFGRRAVDVTVGRLAEACPDRLATTTNEPVGAPRLGAHRMHDAIGTGRGERIAALE